MTNPMPRQRQRNLRPAHQWFAVGQESCGCTVTLEGCIERASHSRSGWPGDALEREKPTAEVVDHSQDRDREEAENEQVGQVRAPQFSAPLHADSPQLVVAVADEIAATHDDSSKRIS